MVKINAKDIPKGWHTIVHTRTSGKTAGKTDNHYFTPDWKHRFRSLVEVRAFLEKKKQDAAPAESADFMVEIDTDGNEVIVIDSSDEEDNDSLFL